MRTPIVARFVQFVFLAFLLSAPASATYAQNSSSATQPPVSTQSSASAQSSASTQSSATQTSASTDATSQTPPKKVWTNEDLGSSHSKPDRPSRQSNANSDTPARPKSRRDAQWYHDQIARLQAQIPPLDKTIAELQAAIDGKTLNEPIHYGGNRIGDWKEQLQQLQTKHQDLLDKITSLEDEARHNGIEPNALP